MLWSWETATTQMEGGREGGRGDIMYFSVSVASGDAAATPPNIAKPSYKRATFKKNSCLTKIPRELKNATLKKNFFSDRIQWFAGARGEDELGNSLKKVNIPAMTGEERSRSYCFCSLDLRRAWRGRDGRKKGLTKYTRGGFIPAWQRPGCASRDELHTYTPTCSRHVPPPHPPQVKGFNYSQIHKSSVWKWHKCSTSYPNCLFLKF